MKPKEMIRALMEDGMTQSEIAQAVGTNQATVCRTLKGSEPRYSTGKRIEKLYQERVGTQAA